MPKKISDYFKVEAKNSNFPEIRECRVILQNINMEIKNKNFGINKSEGEEESNSCQREKTENCIKKVQNLTKRPQNYVNAIFVAKNLIKIIF